MSVLSWQRGASLGGYSVILVHDWAQDGQQWQDAGWVDGLSDFDLLACDLPGHGGSDDIEMPPRRQPAAWAAGAILADVQRLHVSRAAVVGVGMGAVVAGHLAVTATDLIERLVLIGCDDGPVLPNGAEVAAALRSDTSGVWHPEAAELVAKARQLRQHNPETLARWAETVAWPAAPRLGALRTPTVLAVGRDDPRHSRAPRFAALFHDGRLVSVPGDADGALRSPVLTRTIAGFLAEAG